MDLGIVVIIHWVLGDMGIKGNEKADKAAKEATEKSGARRYPERFA